MFAGCGGGSRLKCLRGVIGCDGFDGFVFVLRWGGGSGVGGGGRGKRRVGGRGMGCRRWGRVVGGGGSGS